MIQSVTPSLYISPYNPLRFIERDSFARCYDLNPATTLYHEYNNQPGVEVQPYAQPYSFADRLTIHFYSRYNNNALNLINVSDNSIVDSFALSALPGQDVYNYQKIILDSNSQVSENSFLLVDFLFESPTLNGERVIFNPEMGKNLVGSRILISTPGKIVEAEIVEFRALNNYTLILDRYIDLSGEVSFVIRKRNDLARYYQHQIDLCDYPEGCYKLILQADYLNAFDDTTYQKSVLQVSRVVESEPFNLQKTQPGANLIKYKNYYSEVSNQEVDWTAFSSLDFFEIRVQSQFLPTESSAQKNNIFRASNNVQIVSDQSVNTRYFLQCNYLPWYIHQKLARAFACDQVSVNNMSVLARESYKSERFDYLTTSLGSIELEGNYSGSFTENLS